MVKIYGISVRDGVFSALDSMGNILMASDNSSMVVTTGESTKVIALPRGHYKMMGSSRNKEREF